MTYRNVTLSEAENNRLITLAGAAPDLVDVLKRASLHVPASDDQRAAAMSIHGSDEVEVDEGAGISDPEDGTGYWVQAWVWVST